MRLFFNSLLAAIMLTATSVTYAEGFELIKDPVDLPDLGESHLSNQADSKPAGENAAHSEECLAIYMLIWVRYSEPVVSQPWSKCLL